MTSLDLYWTKCQCYIEGKGFVLSDDAPQAAKDS